MVKHDAHVREWQEKNDSYVGWYDATIEANHWFALSVVEPSEAAMLLCQFNPHTDSVASAKQSENEETSPEQFKQLMRRFEDLQKTAPQCRSLGDWLDFASGAGLRHHSWAQSYQEAQRAGLRDTTPASDAPVPAITASASAGVEPALANWKMLIQAEATSMFKRLRASGANPTIHAILEDLVRWCQSNDVKTDGGIYPKAGYLRTHVLGGRHWKSPR